MVYVSFSRKWNISSYILKKKKEKKKRQKKGRCRRKKQNLQQITSHDIV